MGISEKNTPFDLLLKIDNLYSQSTDDLPEQISLQDNAWIGVGFRLGTLRLIIAINNLEEILTELPYTPIPVVKPWVKGVANMRGYLLPIIDLAELFDIASETTQKQRRIMAVKNSEEGYVGFMVDAVFGMQQLSLSKLSSEISNLPESLQPFVTGVYNEERQNQDWLIFDINRFMASPQFLSIGN